MSYNAIIKTSQSLSQYIALTATFPVLSVEEERNLLHEFYNNHDTKAGHIILNSHLRLVVKIALKYKAYTNSLFDLICEGNLGLMKALKNFTISKNVRFSTYAMLWIKASVQEFILKTMSIVRIGKSSTQKRIIFGLNKVKKYLNIIDNEQYSQNFDKVAKLLNVEQSDLLQLLPTTISANQLLNNDSFIEYGDTIPSDIENPEVIYSIQEQKCQINSKIQNALSYLSDREREIIVKRKILEKPETLSDLSKTFNVSIERIRQLETSAMNKMRKFCNV